MAVLIGAPVAEVAGVARRGRRQPVLLILRIVVAALLASFSQTGAGKRG